MRKIYVLAVEIRQRPAIIQVAEDEVKIIIIGKVPQIVFFLQDDVIFIPRFGLIHKPRRRHDTCGSGFFGHGRHSRGRRLLMDDQNILSGK